MRSLKIHPPPSPPHALTTANQRVPKTPHGRTVMPTRPDPPVAAQDRVDHVVLSLIHETHGHLSGS